MTTPPPKNDDYSSAQEMARTIHLDDICCLKSNKAQLGTIQRTHIDVVAHGSVGYLYSRHETTPLSVFQEFKKTGIPPKGYVNIEWACLPPPALHWTKPSVLIHEDLLEITDRVFSKGDLVKRHPTLPESGTVQDFSATATLIPTIPWPQTCKDSIVYAYGSFARRAQDHLHNISTRELTGAADWEYFTYIAYNGWVGRIANIHSNLGLRLSSGAVVELEERHLRDTRFTGPRMVGAHVTTTRATLQSANFKYGAYDAKIAPEGYICESRSTSIEVDWLCRKYDPSAPPFPKPDSTLESGVLDDVVLIDLPSRNFEQTKGVRAGDIVRFRDAATAANKHDRFKKIPRTSSLGYDINTLLVGKSESRVIVLWQDGTRSEHANIELEPVIELAGEDELSPGDMVILRAADKTVPGVVQSVNAKDRIARVRWFEDANVTITGAGSSILLPDAVFGQLGEVKEVSLYDIWTPLALSRKVGDLVLLITESTSTEIDWFGQIVNLTLDGLLEVCLVATQAQTTVKVSIERTILVGEDDDFDDDDMDMDYEYDYDSDDMSSSVEHVEIEYEGGVRLDDGDDDSWSTESPMDITDTPMTESGENLPISEKAGDGVDIIQDVKHKYYLLDVPPASDHWYLTKTSAANMKRVQKEHRILRESLPDGVYVCTWESRMDLLRILLIGPTGTPYTLAPFVIDMHLHDLFPAEPPHVYFHSWTDGKGAINPNLYEDGKICLSLLGTWEGKEKHESWSSHSTVLQILVSLLGLVLVKEPYFNEAGYEARAGSVESQLPSAMYSERTYFRSRNFIVRALTQPVQGFQDLLLKLYLGKDTSYLVEAITDAVEVMTRSSRGEEGATNEDDGRRVSAGAVILLRRVTVSLMDILRKHDITKADDLQGLLDGTVVETARGIR